MCCTPLTGPGKKTCNTLFNPMGSGGISKEIFKTLQSESHLFQLGHLLPDFPLGFSKVALLCFYVEGSHLGREVVVLEENENQESRCFHVGDKSWRIIQKVLCFQFYLNVATIRNVVATFLNICSLTNPPT